MPSEFSDFVLEMLNSLSGINRRRMFGGYGLFCEGLMFALISADSLYFKVDDVTKPKFEDEGCAPFQYARKGKTASLNYFSAPEFIFDNPELAIEWANDAIGTARRAEQQKHKKTGNY